jgi:hypothetical protein
VRAHGLRRGSLPALTDRRVLGEVGLKVSPFCLGITNDPRVVCEAFDAGMNFFFLSVDMHWPLYELLRRGLEMLFARGGGVRDDVVVAGVSYVTQPEFCFMPFREGIAAVKGLERFDLTIAGCAYASDMTVRLREYAKHRAGLVPGTRAVGMSFHDRTAAVLAVNHALVDLALVRYNAGHPGAAHDLFPAISGERSLVYNFKSTAGFVPASRADAVGIEDGSWVPEITDHYRYVLSCAELDGLLCALTAPAQVAQLRDALAKGPLEAEEIAYIEEIARRSTRVK